MQDEQSLQLQKEAVLSNNWSSYTNHLLEQGATYARMGLSFSEWFDVLTAYRESAYPLIMKEYPRDTVRAIQILMGTDKFLDYSFKAIAHAYFMESRKIIEEKTESEEKSLIAKRTSEERLRAIYENTSDHIFMIDRNFKILFINHTAPGIKKKDVLGANMLDLQPPESRELIKEKLEEVFTKGTTMQYETLLRLPNNAFFFQSSAAPVYSNSRVSHVAIIARNITRQKKAEMEIRQLNEQLEKKVKERTARLKALNEELEGFSYSVSHDLRAPLRAINGYTHILQKRIGDRLDKDETRYMQAVVDSVDKMGRLIDDLLTFSRMGKARKSESFFNIGSLAQKVFEELCAPGDYPTADLLIHEPLPPVRADREMIRQVIVNLLSNALKFSSGNPHTLIEIGLASESESENVFYVKDNGAGFEMEYAHKLFDIFQRLHSDDEFEGTGVGLAIVQRIIHRHHGKVWGESTPKEGATFYFSLPKISTHEK